MVRSETGWNKGGGGGGGGHISKKLFGCSEVTHVHCHIKGGFVQTIDLSFGVLFLFYFIFVLLLF
jgi:hypothetical protein